MKKSYRELKDQYEFNLARPERDDLLDLIFQLAKASGQKIMRVEYIRDDGATFYNFEIKKKSVIYPELSCPEA